jgi:hypothetical protein
MGVLHEMKHQSMVHRGVGCPRTSESGDAVEYGRGDGHGVQGWARDSSTKPHIIHQEEREDPSRDRCSVLQPDRRVGASRAGIPQAGESVAGFGYPIPGSSLGSDQQQGMSGS